MISLRFIDRAEKELEQNAIKATFFEWAFESNITDETEKDKLDYQVRKYINIFITNEKKARIFISPVTKSKLLTLAFFAENFRCN